MIHSTATIPVNPDGETPLARAQAWAKAKIPDLRMIVVAGPHIDPASLVAPHSVEIHAFVPDLDRHLAACNVALVQGGLPRSSAGLIERCLRLGGPCHDGAACLCQRGLADREVRLGFQHRALQHEFAAEVLLQLKLMSVGKSAGFSLEEIAGIFGCDGTPDLPRAVLYPKADEIDRRIGAKLQYIDCALSHSRQ